MVLMPGGLAATLWEIVAPTAAQSNPWSLLGRLRPMLWREAVVQKCA